MTYLRNFVFKNKKIDFPVYFPDATRGVVRSLDSNDLQQSHIEGLVVNTYHLMSQPGTTVLAEMGGIKKFMGWSGLVASDSGGFQLLSLIYRNQAFGKINDQGVIFYRGSQGKKRRYNFTPEKSIQVQFSIEPDIIICLDDCPAKNAKKEEIEKSVDRTIEWAKRCKQEYERQIERRKIKDEDRPKLLAVIQGGDDKKLREKCGQSLLKINFDAYGFGGWPLDESGKVNLDILGYTASLMPDDRPKFALGVGNPLAIVEGFKLGYQIFDCVLPTRDARHERLYIFEKDPQKADILEDKDIFGHLFIGREKYVRDTQPISEYCDCHTCRNYSRAYLHHLFQIEDSLAWRLATIHNLRTYSRLIEILRKNV